MLFKVQLPLAMPTIMAGVNQTLMLALSMVVIASMIAVGGLGQMVLRGIGRLDMGLATVGGVGIVILALSSTAPDAGRWPTPAAAATAAGTAPARWVCCFALSLSNHRVGPRWRANAPRLSLLKEQRCDTHLS
jgi:hypothetical protein